MRLRLNRNPCLMIAVAMALMVSASGAIHASDWYVPATLAFDVTVAPSTDETSTWLYTYVLSIPDLEPDQEDIAEPVWAFMIEGAYHTSDVTQVGANGYTWLPGEVLDPGESPTWFTGLVNPTDHPVMAWGRESLSGTGVAAGVIGTFSFTSLNGPMTREYTALSSRLLEANGETLGPTPGLSPIFLLLGQGVPILGWIGYRRRRQS